MGSRCKVGGGSSHSCMTSHFHSSLWLGDTFGGFLLGDSTPSLLLADGGDHCLLRKSCVSYFLSGRREILCTQGYSWEIAVWDDFQKQSFFNGSDWFFKVRSKCKNVSSTPFTTQILLKLNMVSLPPGWDATTKFPSGLSVLQLTDLF